MLQAWFPRDRKYRPSARLLLLRSDSMAISVLDLSVSDVKLLPYFVPRDLKQECSLNGNS
jgi:hypothetical protein